MASYRYERDIDPKEAVYKRQAHALHGDAGQTHRVDAAKGLGTVPEAFEADLDIRVFVQVEEQGHACAAELAEGMNLSASISKPTCL